MKLMRMFSAVLTVMMIFTISAIAVNAEENQTTVYVSSSGNDQNSGESSSSPVATFAKAYEKGAANIIVVGSATYSDAPSEYSGTVTIKGYTSAATLSLPGTVSIKGNLTIDNLVLSNTSTIYANGHSLEIGRGVTSTSRMTVYGGKNGSNVDGNTDVKLYGGKYSTIHGGCNGGNVNGSTYVTVGGDVNPGDNVIEGNSSISPCSVYGGSTNGTVTGSTNITFSDNAVVQQLIGSGYGENGVVYETNINVTGGQVLSIVGGAAKTVLTSCSANVTMTGGYVVNLFGGSQSVTMTGHTYIRLIGGEVIRRVYSGCYNDTSTLSSNTRTLSGTTVIEIYPEMTFFKSTNLVSSDDTSNQGVFGGSRSSKSSHSGETNTVIFMNDCYSSKSSVLGAQSWLEKLVFKNHINYTVKSGTGGRVSGTNTAGKIYIFSPISGNTEY